MKLKLEPRQKTEECTHPVLKDCGGGYWWCMQCGARLTNEELATKPAAAQQPEQVK